MTNDTTKQMTDNNTTDEPTVTRRETLAGLAGGLGVALGASPVQATGTIDGQFLLDTRSADSDAWREEVEVVAEVPEIGFASVRGDQSSLEGYRFAEEVELEITPPAVPDAAPAADGTETAPDVSPTATDGDAPPTPHPFQWDKAAQGVRDLHDAGITGEGTTVAVVDSGIDADHPDLDVNTAKSGNFSAADSIGPVPAEYHGTHVAGIAAADGANAGDGGPYVVGMAPGAELLDMKVFPFRSSASFLDAIRAAVDAGADVVNMSFGPGSPYGPSVASDLNTDAYRRVGEYARSNGALLVESAGNADTNIDAVPEKLTNSGKGTVPGFLQVSATGPVTTESYLNENLAFGNVADTTAPSYYTNYGPESVDVSAPGGLILASDFDGVLSTMPPDVPGGSARLGSGEAGAYGTLQGTSMAAPNAAGLAALVKSQNPNATPDQLKRHLKDTAETITEAPPDIFRLFGIGIGYLGDVERTGTVSNDAELEDPYSSETYRGDGHIDTTRAVEKPVRFAGGVSVDGVTYTPADPDDDGLYEDVNGDGTVDMDDVALLYQMAVRNAVTGADAAAFDFDGDGDFDVDDVQALLRRVDGV